jgi:hypothetical protein
LSLRLTLAFYLPGLRYRRPHCEPEYPPRAIDRHRMGKFAQFQEGARR